MAFPCHFDGRRNLIPFRVTIDLSCRRGDKAKSFSIAISYFDGLILAFNLSLSFRLPAVAGTKKPVRRGDKEKSLYDY